jgi:hypothetical protein
MGEQMTVTSPPGEQSAAQLLRILYDYVVTYFPSHPTLLPAVAGLREAAGHYRNRNAQQAFQRASEVYQYLLRVRAGNPDLPLP